MVFKFAIAINDPEYPLSEVQVKGKVVTIYLKCKTYDPDSFRFKKYINTSLFGAGGSKIVLVDADQPEHDELHTNDAEKERMHYHFKHEFDIDAPEDALMCINKFLRPFYVIFPQAQKIDSKAFRQQFKEYREKEASEEASINEASTALSQLNLLTSSAGTLFSAKAEKNEYVLSNESVLSEEFANRYGS